MDRCTAVCAKSGRASDAPAMGSGRSTPSAFAARHSPWLCPPPWRAQKWFPVGRVCLPGCGALSCLAARPRWALPCRSMRLQPRSDSSPLAPTFHRRSATRMKVMWSSSASECMLLVLAAILGTVTFLGPFLADRRRIPHQAVGSRPPPPLPPAPPRRCHRRRRRHRLPRRRRHRRRPCRRRPLRLPPPPCRGWLLITPVRLAVYHPPKSLAVYHLR